MNTKRILWGLILATIAIFFVLYVIAQEYGLATASVVLGLIWLALEMNERPGYSWFFFLIFLTLAILGSLKNIAPLVIPLGFSTDLAAWDISRFRARIARAANPIALEASHLPKLAVIACAGYFVALLPILVQVSTNFLIVCLMFLVMVVSLRQAAFYLRDSSRGHR